MFGKLRIAQKLNIFLVIISLLGAIFGFLINRLNLEKNNLFARVASLSEMENLAIKINLYYRDVIFDVGELVKDPSLAGQYYSNSEAKLSTFNQGIEQYRKGMDQYSARWPGALKTKFSELLSANNSFINILNDYIAGLNQGSNIALEELNQKIFNAITHEKQVLNDLEKLQQEDEAYYSQQLVSFQKIIDLLIVILILALILIAALLSGLMYSSLVNAIQKLSLAAKQISSGDFSKRVNIKSQDEIGDLAQAFNNMAKNLEEKISDLEKFKLAIDNSNDHIIITDPESVILYTNKAVEKITGYKRKEIIGKKPSLWGGLMDKDFYAKMWHIIKEEKTIFLGEIFNKRKKGGEYIAQISIYPILDENKNLKFFVGIERDITEEKEIDRAKTEFVSLASHQLRTPLSAIKWNAEAFLGKVKLKKQDKKYIEEVYSGNERMIKLVNSLLNVSRLEMRSFAVDPEPIAISKIIESILADLDPLIKNKNLKIIKEFNKLPDINLDLNLSRIVLENILTNAVKYTPAKGRIKIMLKKQKAKILIEIEDNGYGIPQKAQKKIFTKLFRADNIKEKDTDGTGLGLYIVKKILDATNGKIWFSSQEGSGTAFFISLPLGGMKEREGLKKLV